MVEPKEYDIKSRRSANTPLHSIFEPKEKYTDNIGKVIHLRPI